MAVNGPFRDFFNAKQQQIFVFFVKRGFNEEDAGDLCQATFLNAFKGYQDIREPGAVDAWLLCIARNVYKNELRRRGRRVAEVSACDEAIAEDNCDILEQIISREEGLQLEEALTQLPDQMRRCLLLYHYQELKYHEIADTMQLRVNTVKSHLHQGRKKLKLVMDRITGSRFSRS